MATAQSVGASAHCAGGLPPWLILATICKCLLINDLLL